MSGRKRKSGHLLDAASGDGDGRSEVDEGVVVSDGGSEMWTEGGSGGLPAQQERSLGTACRLTEPGRLFQTVSSRARTAGRRR